MAHTHLLISAGVATDAKMGSELIQVLALDADIGNNSLVFYSILAIHYFRALANDSEDVGQVFTMGRGLATQDSSSRGHCLHVLGSEEVGAFVGTSDLSIIHLSFFRSLSTLLILASIPPSLLFY